MNVAVRTFTLLSLIASAVNSLAQVNWVGDTTTVQGSTPFPRKGAYCLPGQSITVTTHTWPIAPGQSVNIVYTTDGWATTRTQSFNFDGNVGNNTRWYSILGPFPQGTDVQFYIRANHTNGNVVYDNNNNENFGYTWRYTPAPRRGAILQWFATSYRTMMLRLPEVVQAGYTALYVPPVSKSGGGGFSVGYNPFDRFDTGDRFQLGTVATRYGTSQELQDLIRLAKRFGLEVYADLVPNHNDNRASTGIDRYPDLIPEDFHIRSSADTGNNEINFNNESSFTFGMLNHELVGLVDIAQEDGNNTRTGNFVLPSYAVMNMWGKPAFERHPLTPQYYPGGVVRSEDVREYLRRFCWHLMFNIGFDGFRIDAVKHTLPGFFMLTQGQAAGQQIHNAQLLPYIYSLNPNAYIFAEDLTTNSYEMREYAKTGMQLLDFPLKFSMRSVFNSQGFGDLSTLANGYGVDSGLGMAFQNGGIDPAVGVTMVQSHDDGPPQSNNMAHAFILTRPGQPLVYFDGNNMVPDDYSQFPRPGRFDALGAGGDTVLRLTDARYRFGRGTLFNRWVSAKLYIYERHVNGQAVLLTGLNLRGDFTALTQTVQTAFPAGTVLEDLSGQQPNVTVSGNGSVTITVPSNSVPGNSNNARGYVVYAPITAKPLPGIEPVSVTDASTGANIPLATVSTPSGLHAAGGSFRAGTITSNLVNVRVRTDSRGHQAYLILNNGQFSPTWQPISNSPEGILNGSRQMTKAANGDFSLNNVDLTLQPDGLHMFRVRVLNDNGGGPLIWQDYYYWFYLSRGLGTNWVVDGDLSEFGGNALVWQSRPGSSNSNRLDGLFVQNDDRYLYIGLAGQVDTSGNLTNGVGLFIDPAINGVGSITDPSLLADDSGPVTRLLSNTNITSLPGSFRTKMALGTFRQSRLGSSPEASHVGQPTVPGIVGAQAGFFQVVPERLWQLLRRPASIAWRPRTSPTGPFYGLEAAIPLRELTSAGANQEQPIGFLAFLGSTGEAGTVLPASDPSRGPLGGRPAARGWMSNQFLPPQPNMNADPGTSNIAIAQVAQYVLRQPARITSVTVTAGPVVVDPGNANRATQVVTLRNTSPGAVIGPVWLRLDMGRNTSTVVNRRDNSVFKGNRPYFQITPGNMSGNQEVTLTIIYSGQQASSAAPTFTVFAGPGAL